MNRAYSGYTFLSLAEDAASLVYMKKITFIWLGQCKSLQHTIMPYFVHCSTGSKERIFLCHRLVSVYSAMQCNFTRSLLCRSVPVCVFVFCQ